MRSGFIKKEESSFKFFIMAACEKPFSWIVLEWAFTGTEFVLRWFIFFFTGLAGPFVPTTKELQKPWILFLKRAFLSPFYLLGTIALLSPAYTAFLFRYFIHLFRNPYNLSVSLVERPWLLERKRKVNTEESLTVYPHSNSDEAYSFMTMNLCLLPELCSKFNNLDQTRHRAKTVGERIIIDQFFFTDVPQDNQQHTLNGYTTQFSKNGLKNASDMRKKFGISSHFSHLDFICCQETFDRDSAKLLVHELHKKFPWVVYDVGICGVKTNLCGLNSGLMIASRYPVLDVGFKQFGTKMGLDLVCDKGLLMIKVGLDGFLEKDHNRVGYIFNTHIQAFPGDKPIVKTQLDNLLEWTESFRQETHCKSERIVFDVLCGDFNIDNISPGELHHGKHKLFTVYKDFGRVRQGKDKDWVVGTEMRIPTLQDEAVSTPAGLKAVLEDPYMRQQYIIDADIESATMSNIIKALPKKDKHGNIFLSPVGGKRRIDWILYRDDNKLEVTDYHFVTRLASLTDHIPVAMTIDCSHM